MVNRFSTTLACREGLSYQAYRKRLICIVRVSFSVIGRISLGVVGCGVYNGC
jgi:hypothetical protein